MRVALYSLVILVFADIDRAVAEELINIRQMGNGWIGFTKQADPFDKSKIEVIQISKGDFTFRCDELNMRVNSYGFESLSFGADLKYMIDDQMPVDKKGRFSTYLGGSDMVTDSRYYSFKLTTVDVDVMKAGTAMKVAGKYSSAGWQTKSVSLMGFTSAYNQMCK